MDHDVEYASKDSSAEKTEGSGLRGGLAAALFVAGASFVLGGMTSFAQGFLPESLGSFANSASGWTFVTAVLIFIAKPRWLLAAVLGAASFVLLTVGYAVVSQMRGLYYNPLMFSVIGVVVGPFVGVAASGLRADGLRKALGTALLAGIGIGEGIYGLTVVADTTSPVYWTLSIVVGVALLVGSIVRGLRGAVPLIVAVAGTAAVAAAFNVAYSSL